MSLSLCLFDLGGVILDFDFQIASRRLAPLCQLSPEEVFRRMASWEGVIPFEEGKIEPPQFFEAIKDRLHFPLGYEAFLPLWNEIFTEKKEVSGLVRRLLRRIPMALISNTNRLHFDYCYKNFPIVREIGRFFLSCEVGSRKPDPPIYQAALSHFKVPPEKVLYVDDLEKLVEAGRGLGLDAILFRDAGTLEKALRERRLL